MDWLIHTDIVSASTIFMLFFLRKGRTIIFCGKQQYATSAIDWDQLVLLNYEY